MGSPSVRPVLPYAFSCPVWVWRGRWGELRRETGRLRRNEAARRLAWSADLVAPQTGALRRNEPARRRVSSAVLLAPQNGPLRRSGIFPSSLPRNQTTRRYLATGP